MSTTQSPETDLALSITPVALGAVRQFMKSEDIAEATGGLRVSVMPGGCSGFKYSLLVEEAPVDDDTILTIDGVRVFVDPFSAQYLSGVTIDYVTSMQASGFSFKNPNAVGGCGCGTSFSA